MYEGGSGKIKKRERRTERVEQVIHVKRRKEVVHVCDHGGLDQRARDVDPPGRSLGSEPNRGGRELGVVDGVLDPYEEVVRRGRAVRGVEPALPAALPVAIFGRRGPAHPDRSSQTQAQPE